MFEFGWPLAFALLPLPVLAWWLLPPFQQQRVALVVPFFDRMVNLTGEKPGAGAVIARRSVSQHVARVLGWALIVTALASPQWVGEPLLVVKEARDLMVAVDISASLRREKIAGPDIRFE